MCTLIVIDRLVGPSALWVASNRDEFLNRPSASPTLISGLTQDRPSYVAPQDLEAGGTWLGVNAAGLFAGLTNRATASPAKGKRSRGLLVRDALQHRTASEAAASLWPDLADQYNPFHLFLGDGKDAFLFVQREQGATRTVLEPGRHVICNRDPADPASQKRARIASQIDEIDLGASRGRTLGALASILRSHPSPGEPHENPCVHSGAYGTRSSTLLALGGRARPGLWHAEGHPCEAKYRNYSRLLASLGLPGAADEPLPNGRTY